MFSGCLRNVIMNGNLMMFEIVQMNGGYFMLKLSCKKDENCVLDFCKNEGVCDVIWIGFECYCLDDFVGSWC